MIEKIKELLGEELTRQVAEKLGEVELAIMNDGTVVKADKHDTLKSEFKALEGKYETDISTANSKLETAINNSGDYDTLKGTLETMKAENIKIAEQHHVETLNIKKNSAVEVALLKANVDASYVDIVKAQIKTDTMNFDGDILLGLDDKVRVAQDKFPKLFGEIKKHGATPPGDPMNPPTGARQALIDQYDSAQKQGNAKQMMTLQNKIQNLKE